MTAELKEDNCVESLLSAVKELTEKEEDLLQYGKKTVRESVEGFVNGKIGKMFGLAGAYRKCLDRLGLKTKRQLENLIRLHSGNKKVREAGEDLLDVEQDWDMLLTDVDKQLEGDDSDTVQIGQTGPIDISLTDARTGQTTTLKELQGSTSQSQIEAVNGEVIVISFGLREGAVQWLNETECPFPVLLDTERKIYHSFGLKRSVYKVWSVDCLVYYAEAMVEGRELPKPYENVHDDTQQMGGDFILDCQGRVQFLYPSKTNTDRPTVQLILDQLTKISRKS